ncbi:MAG: hypothetical protein HKN65_12350 [Woeseiaceae bacterium]|nr:hypothetical protein [Woeseiaceae bacterium]
MKKRSTETLLIVVSGLLWLAMVGLAAAGHWFAGLYALLGLLLVYGVLGTSHKGRFDLKLVAFPSLVWLVMWAAAFWLGNHYAELYAGRAPDFTVFGFHPSFAAIVVLFWVVPTLLMGFGFEAVKDRWLSQERWDEFLRRVHDTDAGNDGEDRA